MKIRELWIWGGLVVTASLVLAFSVSSLLSAQQVLRSGLDDLSLCRNYARDIRRLKQRPRLASMGLDSPEQTLRRVSQSMQQAGIDRSVLVSVAPSAPMRIASSQYQTRSTELSLRNISLIELAELADSITVDEDGSMLRDLVLTASAQSASNASKAIETWDVRLTLTQLIYSPTSE